MQLRRFAVIGHPIGHTMSPFIHDRLFSLTGHKPEYSVLDVPSLTQALPALRTLDGFNITIPHKSDIIPLLDGIDEKAKLFGSVNTVRVEDGKMTGYTTDGVGCKKALARYGLDFNGELLLLGRGGAAVRGTAERGTRPAVAADCDGHDGGRVRTGNQAFSRGGAAAGRGRLARRHDSGAFRRDGF